jgi:hypothetical protein
MKSFLPLVCLTLAIASCTTYKSGQTPDDVYFSPERPKEEYVRQDEKEEEEYREQERTESDDDRYTRMKVRNRSKWTVLDEYYRDPYAYTYKGCYCACNYNPRLHWSQYYNPYTAPIVIYNPKSAVVNRPRTYNLHVFDGPQNNTYNPKVPSTQTRQYSTPSARPSTNTGSVLRSVFGGSSNPPSGTTTTTSSSGNSSSKPAENTKSGSGSSSAPVRKF